jgi:thiamine-phosphate pyrophosphorylase
MTKEEIAKLQRIVDANLNRLKEGLRVLEDLQRYFFDDPDYSSRFKALRHRLQQAYNTERLRFRDIENDVSKGTTESERRRERISDLMIANFSRAEESARVLEEIFKLLQPELSGVFKEIRYELYALEKELLTEPAKKRTSNSKER